MTPRAFHKACLLSFMLLMLHTASSSWLNKFPVSSLPDGIDRVVAACQEDNLFLQCTNRYNRLLIKDVFYGRDNRHTCASKISDPSKMCEHAHESITEKINLMCSGENRCKVPITPEFLEKPGTEICPHVRKYIRVKYICEQSPHLHMKCGEGCGNQCWPMCTKSCCEPQPKPMQQSHPRPGKVQTDIPISRTAICSGDCPSRCAPLCTPTCCQSAPIVSSIPLPPSSGSCLGSCPSYCAPSCSSFCCSSARPTNLFNQPVPQIHYDRHFSMRERCPSRCTVTLCSPGCNPSCCTSNPAPAISLVQNPPPCPVGCPATCAPLCQPTCCQSHSQMAMAPPPPPVVMAPPQLPVVMAPPQLPVVMAPPPLPVAIAPPSVVIAQPPPPSIVLAPPLPMAVAPVQILAPALIPVQGSCPGACPLQCAPLCQPTCCRMAQAVQAQSPCGIGCPAQCAPLCQPTCCQSTSYLQVSSPAMKIAQQYVPPQPVAQQMPPPMLQQACSPVCMTSCQPTCPPRCCIPRSDTRHEYAQRQTYQQYLQRFREQQLMNYYH